jgi:diguanylate cyclase (GGDEF)-like protein
MQKANVVSRLAAVALIAVFIGTALLTLSSARSIRQNRARSDEAQAMSARFGEASRQAKEAERYIVLWTSDPVPAYLVEQKRSQEALAAALDAIAASTETEDRRFGEWAKIHFGAMSRIFERLLETPPPRFEDILDDYAIAYTSLYESVASGDIGDPALANQLINPAEVTDVSQLTSNPVAVIMAAKVAERDITTFEAMRAVGSAEQRYRRVAPALYVFGTLLAGGLLAITIRFGRQEAVTVETNAHLRRLATTDALTELGNRRGFEEATQRLATAPSGGPVSLIVLDLDEFKVVNDTFGHARGDAILTTFAELLSRLAPPGASRFRIGGDEFALLAHGFDETASMDLARRVIRVAEAELGSGVSVTAGVAMLGEQERDESLLRQRADAALYEGKLRGRNIAVLYTHEDSAAPVFPAAKVNAIRKLLDEGRIEAAFQPIWSLQTGAIFGYEGLSRPDADYGLTGPEEAFDIAEQFGHAAELDQLCRTTLLKAASALPEGSRVFLNVSPYSLTHHSFSPKALMAEFEAAGFARDRVVFEVTERSRVSTTALAEAVAALRAEKVCVALDDVGAGNNGLEMLRNVQVDLVKVDKSVICAATEAGGGRAVLAAILAFCSESGVAVVAEGIEDTEMLATVVRASQAAAHGRPPLVHGVQGFLFGLPAPASGASVVQPPLLAA